MGAGEDDDQHKLVGIVQSGNGLRGGGFTGIIIVKRAGKRITEDTKPALVYLYQLSAVAS